jgi:uncharacterized protein YfdQ (DUF2303 family)
MRDKPDTTVLIEAGMQLGQIRQLGQHEAFVVLPTGDGGARVESLAPLRLEQPPRVRQGLTLHEVHSFIAYVNEFKDHSSRIFADIAERDLEAVLDYHISGVEPRWCEHRAVLTLQHSESWKRWTAASGRAMAQIVFAQFIEDNLLDVAWPSGAEIIEVSRSLEAKMNVSFASAVRLDNGEQQFTYEEQISGTAARGTLKVPDRFTLGLPVFQGGEKYALEARLRYRIKDGGLAMWVDLVRSDLVLEDAFTRIRAEVAEKTSIEVLAGLLAEWPDPTAAAK